MDDKRITAEEIKAALAGDIDELSAQIAEAMNTARDGAIINDSEIPIWRATNAFREALANKAVGLVQKKHEDQQAPDGAFSPSAGGDAESRLEEDHGSDDERSSGH